MSNKCRWENFISELKGNFNTDDNKLASWNGFINSFKEFYYIQKIENDSLPVKKLISYADYQSFFDSFQPGIKDYYKSGFAANLWEVTGVRRDEMRNSAILSWLLDCHGSHGQGCVFLKELLSWLSQNAGISPYMLDHLPKPEDAKNNDYWTRVESLPLGELESRVDIEIGGPFVLIIEVKVNSKENGDQLKRYLEIAKKKAGNNKKWGVVYLTRHGTPPAKDALKDKICTISWKQVAAIVEKVVTEHITKNTYIEHQLRQLCYHIKSL